MIKLIRPPNITWWYFTPDKVHSLVLRTWRKLRPAAVSIITTETSWLISNKPVCLKADQGLSSTDFIYLFIWTQGVVQHVKRQFPKLQSYSSFKAKGQFSAGKYFPHAGPPELCFADVTKSNTTSTKKGQPLSVLSAAIPNPAVWQTNPHGASESFQGCIRLWRLLRQKENSRQ